MLVCGPNGVGKSTLLCGIYTNQLPVHWTQPPPQSILFCPQVTVLFTGSALDLLGESLAPDERVEGGLPADEEDPLPLLTASAAEDLDDGLGRVREAMNAVGLDNCQQFDLEKVYSAAQWKTLLTPGQLNRLALARVLLKKPQFALLDETLMTLSAEEAGILLERFQQQGTTVLATAHEPSTEFKSLFSKIKEIK
jgi:ABC-type uncharacterized transport system fused permease/ATPase subunit